MMADEQVQEEAAVDTEREAQIAATLKDIIGNDEPAPAVEEPADEPAEEAEESAQDPVDEGPDEEPDEGQEVAPEGWDLRDTKTNEAYHALKREGYPDDVLEGMSKERLLEIGTKRLEHQKEVDAAFRERDRLRSKAPKEPDDDQGEEGATAQSTASIPQELIDAARPIAEELGLGDEAAELLAKSMQAAADSAAAPLRKQLETVNETRANEALGEARRALEESLPEALDSETWEKVKQTAHGFHVAGRHSELQGSARLNALMQDAARFELNLPSEAEQERQQKTSRQRAQGSPTSGSRRRRQSIPTDHAERQNLAAKLAAEGKSSDEIKRRIGG